MYLNDKLEIICYKNDTFNLRIRDKCIKLNENSILIFKVKDLDNKVIFSKNCFVYENVAYLNMNSNDISNINIGNYTYTISISLDNINDTIIYNSNFIMKG